MSFISIIEKKKNKIELSEEEINFLIEGFLSSSIKDYQMSSFLMVVYFLGLTDKELFYFTKAMVNSGSVYKLKDIIGPIADKHSTGGVGDKTSLIYGPLVAKFGVKVAKISGRGLGKTGGTIDKLESCTGWTSELTESEFINNINNVGISIIGQSNEIVPADKLLYALRDVCGSVNSIPLIASSIMSKKLAIRTTSIVLDVKVGKGAFMENIEDALILANKMIIIGKHYNRDVSVMLTNMDYPLGNAIGNALEVKEAWDTLNGNGPKDLEEISILAAAITLLDNNIFDDIEVAKLNLRKVINDKSAAYLLKDFVENQNGDFNKIINFDQYFKTKFEIEIRANDDGYLVYESDKFGYLSMNLGAGRKTKKDIIDYSAGIKLHKSSGEFVKNGDLLFTMYTNINNVHQFNKMAASCFKIVKQNNNEKLVLKVISKHYNL
ncbi:thymidine phosphorylase [Spiroplasma corruscae]|uniref:Thymidine phosphorylase n=1 Tax=Spiroplasma corruscae TaxID=216934 RepID=A0A222ENG5_9MOLU|nr:thymidine phosphorylase [Spiroplasma corruscae]ASP28032.1 thymidine phosphorylase [Spiroplasma corruscae]